MSFQKIENSLKIEGNILITGTVDGRDVATDGSTLDSHVATSTAHGVSGDVVGTTNTQTLTNKTITSNTNNIIARELWAGSGASAVSTYASSAPAVGQILKATGSSTATWQNESTGGSPDFKTHARMATTTAGTLSTDFENGDTIDGVTLATSDRILIKDQSTGSENGVYVVQASGAPIRASDMANGTSAGGAVIFVIEGTANGDQGFICINDAGSDVVNTDALTFNIFTSTGSVSGPGSATDNAIVRWDGATGTAIQDSNILISDTDSISGVANIGMSGDILDANNNELINFTTTASAVNEVGITNATTGNAPQLSATGDDSNIDLNFATKGTGAFSFSAGDASTSAELRLEDNTGGQYIAMTIPATVTNRTHTIPDVSDDTFTMNTATQTLSNKTLTSPVISTISNTGTVTLPTATDTLVGRATTDTLTNKTISASSNTVGANEIRTTGASVIVDTASPPTTGQVLTATSATSANWQTNSPSLTTSEITGTTATSTTSSSYVVINSMTTTPASGTYMVSFSASGDISNGNADADYAIHNDGSIVTHSLRHLGHDGGAHTGGFKVTFYTQAIVTVNGSQAIDVRYKTSSGTFTVDERSMILLKV